MRFTRHQVSRLVAGVFLSLLPEVLSENVSVSWKPSPSEAAIGYNLYYTVNGGAAAKIDAGSNLSAVVTDLQAGSTYTFYATAYDGLGDESGPSPTLTYKANSPPTAANRSVQTYKNQAVNISLTATDSDLDTLTFSVVSPPGNGVISGVAPNLSYTPAANYVGSDSFTYKANDGKVDSNVATVSINVVEPPDTTSPVVAITTPAAASTLSGTVTIRISASDNIGVKRVELYMNGALKATAAGSSAALSWDTTQGANGSWTLQAKAYDLSGNLGTSSLVSVTVQNVAPDTNPPSVSILSPGPTSTVSGSVQVSALTSDDVGVTQVKSFVNGTLLGTSSSPTPSFPWDTTKYADGFYTVDVQAFDATGNSTKASVTGVKVANVVADTTAPTVSITSPSSGATLDGSIGITVQASDSVGVTKLELLVDGTVVGSANLASTTFFLNTTTLSNGSHTISVRAHDAAGNIGSDSIKVEVQNGQLDTTAPKVAITSPKNGSTIRKNTSIKVNSNDNVGVVLVELYLDGALSARSTSTNPSFTLVTSMISDGLHTLVAKAYDAAGNAGESSTVQIKK